MPNGSIQFYLCASLGAVSVSGLPALSSSFSRFCTDLDRWFRTAKKCLSWERRTGYGFICIFLFAYSCLRMMRWLASTLPPFFAPNNARISSCLGGGKAAGRRRRRPGFISALIQFIILILIHMWEKISAVLARSPKEQMTNTRIICFAQLESANLHRFIPTVCIALSCLFMRVIVIWHWFITWTEHKLNKKSS